MFKALGGRKLVFGMLSLACGVIIELFGKNGLSANMVALIGAVYATFSASNAMITSKFGGDPVPAPPAALEPEAPEVSEPTPPPQQAEGDVTSKVANIITQNNQQLGGILNQIGSELVKQQDVNERVLTALNTLQTSQTQVQKALVTIIGRGQG